MFIASSNILKRASLPPLNQVVHYHLLKSEEFRLVFIKWMYGCMHTRS